MASQDSVSVPFSFFVELVQAIADIKPHKATDKQSRNARYDDSPAYKTFRRWVTALRERYSPLPHDTITIVFRFLFPDEDCQRKYGMQEARLAQHLTKVLAVSSDTDGRGERLRNWKQEDTLGCLGNEIFTIMSATTHSQASTTSVSLAQVDALLAELASKCAFSDASVRTPFTAAAPRRTREAILTSLFASLTPAEGAILTQIILKDLRPLLYPIPRSATHYTAALLQYKSNAVTMLTKEAGMHAWDPTRRMSQIFKSRANLEETTRTYESLQPGDALPKPEYGTPVQIPKCVKGQGTAQALRVLRGADKVWVETKYDGERAQIHVRLHEDGLPRIKIFSKSGRDSTLDRAGIHTIICDALGIPRRPSMLARAHTVQAPVGVAAAFTRDIIIEAEMVAFSEVLDHIDEFWRIRSLIGSTAMGVRHKTPAPRPASDCDIMESQQSLVSNGSDGGTRHLALVFFDVLLHDGVSLLSLPYSDRRNILERTIRVSPGFAMLAERICIDMTRPNADELFRKAFSSLVADREEGAVLKVERAAYNERRWPWVKLKRDYIQNYGDTVDLVLLGASWEKDRARELRVPPTAYTTFYFAVLANAEAVKANPSQTPHFEVIFTSSYGLSREELEDLNFMVKSSDPLPYRPQGTKGLPYTYTLSPNLSPPVVFIQRPFLADLFGAGFSKAPGSKFYELRFPRITKVYRPCDRPWTDGIPLAEYQQIARVAVGRDRPGKAEDDWVKGIFRPNQPLSPGVRCPQKRKEMELEWMEKFAAVDKNAGTRRNPTKKARMLGPGPKRTSNNAENVAQERGVGRTDKLTIPESPNPRTGLGRLGSVTNIAAFHPSARPVSQHKTPSPQDIPYPPTTPPPRESAHGLRTPTSSPFHQALRPDPTSAGSPDATGKIVTEAIQDHPPTRPLRVPSPERNDAPPCTSPSPLSTLHRYLQDAVVWMARPSGIPRPLWRAPSHAVIPIGNQVNSLDAVTLACGWDNVMTCSWAKRGVVFVDDLETTSAYTTQVLGQLAKRRAALLEEDKVWDRKAILVLSTKMLAYDTLDRATTKEDLEARAICRFG